MHRVGFLAVAVLLAWHPAWGQPGTAPPDAAPAAEATRRLRESLARMALPPVAGSLAPNTRLPSAAARTIGDGIRACYVSGPGRIPPETAVRLVVTTDATGTVRSVEQEAGSPVSGVQHTLIDQARRAVLDPRCATLPLPPAMLGTSQRLTITFHP